MTVEQENALRARAEAAEAQVAYLLRLTEHLTRQLDRIARAMGVPVEEPPPAPETVPPAPSAPVPLPAPAPGARKATPHGRGVLPPELPREENVLAPERCDTCGGDRLRRVNADVAEQIHYVAGHWRVRRTTRHICACVACDKLVTVPPPSGPIDRGRFTPEALAQIAWSKFGLHLPLDRQRRELARHGFRVEESTLCDQVGVVADAVAPIARRLREVLLTGDIVQTDGTGLQVLTRGQRKAHLGQIAVYGHGPIAVFAYTPTKEGKHASAFLGGFRGYLVADAASVFDRLYVSGAIVEVGCWAHARRKFEEAADSDPRAASEALAFVSRFYDLEHQARERQLDRDGVHLLRTTETRAELDRLRSWLDAKAATALPKSPIGKAIAYACRHWAALTRFLEDPRLPLDNNASERALRAVAVGRANYVFAGSDAGAHRAATLYTVLTSCRLAGVDPYAWLTDVLRRVATHPVNRLDELLPHRWVAEPKEVPQAR